MISETISVDHVIEVLNRATESDKSAILALVNTRVFCNRKLADDPTIQVRDTLDGTYLVGVLGILNGLFGVDKSGYGAIAIEYEVVCPEGHVVENGKVVGHQCTECGRSLELGSFLGFRRMRREDLKGQVSGWLR